MPATSPRIAVYLPKATYLSVKRLAALRGVGMSAVVRDLMIETAPVLDRVAALLDMAARADKNALKGWAQHLDRAQSETEESALSLITRMDDMRESLALVKTAPAPVAARAERGRRNRPPRVRGPKRGH